MSPSIPNNILQEYATNTLNLKITSDISILRFNPTDQMFGHVVSWRHQVYTTSDLESLDLPESFELPYNNNSYSIFITLNEFTFFKCKSKGHPAEDCTAQTEVNVTPTSLMDIDLFKEPQVDLSSDFFSQDGSNQTSVAPQDNSDHLHAEPTIQDFPLTKGPVLYLPLPWNNKWVQVAGYS